MFLNNIMIYTHYRYDEYSYSNIFNDKKTFNTNIITKNNSNFYKKYIFINLFFNNLK